MAQRVRYPDHIEPLVQFVEETAPERIVAATHDKLAAGTPVKDMLLASALAVVRSSDQASPGDIRRVLCDPSVAALAQPGGGRPGVRDLARPHPGRLRSRG